MKSLSLMISPTDNCNINCSYCYNLPRRVKHGSKVIEKEVVEQTLRLVNEYVEVPMTQLVWHGGEPLLMGSDWFRSMQPLMFQNSTNTMWDQGIQTNSTLINEEWIQLFKEYNISISTSYDVFTQGHREKEDKVWRNIILMLQNGIRPGIITGVNAENYTRLIDMYEFFKERGIGGFCFNNVYILEDAPNEAQRLKLDPDAFVKEWGKYFKYWLSDYSDRIIYERSITDALAVIFSTVDLPCGSRDCQTEYLTVNCNGDITTCNRYCPEQYILGNIMDYSNIDQIYESLAYKKYILAIEERKVLKCNDCSYLPYCRGGCKLNHMLKKAEFDTDVCLTFKGIFDTTYKNIRTIRIEDPQINSLIFGVFSTAEFFTVYEIKRFLHTLGYNGEIEYDENDIPNCVEFKLFRLFNSRLSKRILHNIPMIKHDRAMLSGENFISSRRSTLISIYTENAKQIHEVLKKRK